MNTFIFLGCVPVPEWQHKIDFVTKTVLDKENTYILVRKKIYILPPQRTPLGVFGVKKVAVLGGGEFAVVFGVSFLHAEDFNTEGLKATNEI